MKKRVKVYFNTKKGYWICPFCEHKLEKTDILYGHIYRHHRERIYYKGQKLNEYERLNNSIVSEHQCGICFQDGLSKKDHVIRHLKVHDGKELFFPVEIIPKKKQKVIFSKKQFMTKKSAHKFLMQVNAFIIDTIAFDKKEAPIKGKFADIREFLGLLEPKPVCDQLVKLQNDEHYFAEFTSLDVTTALFQLRSTINFCREKFQVDMPYAILYIKKFGDYMKKRFRRNDNIWTLEEKTKRSNEPFKIGKTPIFVAQENDKMETLFKKIGLYLSE